MPSDEENASKQEDLRVLIQKRGQIKATVTRFNSFFDNFQEEGSLTQLKDRLAKVVSCLEEYEIIQSQIEILDDSQASDRDVFETTYFEITALAKDFISSKTPTPQTTAPLVQTSSPTVNAPHVRLPSISLPSFSGNYDDWVSFSDSFQALIHNNETLSDFQRLHYLKSTLKDEAAQVVKALELTATNYPVAWQLLEDRFRNERLIVEKHVKAIFDLPAMDRESSVDVRKLLDGTLTHMRALKALDQPTDHWDTLIIHVLRSKLPTITHREWEHSIHPKKLPTLNQLTDFLDHRSQILESSNSNKASSTAPSSNVHLRKPNTQNSFVTQDDSCRYCKGKHAVYQCKALLNLAHDQRVQALKQAGLCFNCLRPGHTVSQCRSSGCKKCGNKHNTLLHDDSQSRHQPSNAEEIPQHNSTIQTPASSSTSLHCHLSTLGRLEKRQSIQKLEDPVIGRHKNLHVREFPDAIVKSPKDHRRSLGALSSKKTNSALTQVEAGLHSYPLTCLSIDPYGNPFPTLYHFPFNGSLKALADRWVMPIPEHCLSRFHRSPQPFQPFWTRWPSEQPHNLQQRTKW